MEYLITFNAIGTKWWINIFDSVQEDKASKLNTEIELIANDFESKYSRFIKSSLISRINNGENLKDIPIDLQNMFNIAEKVKKITDGHFNINIGGTLENLGYNSDYSFVETENNTNRIDLGGIGKGYLIDKIKDYLLENSVEYFFINAGGDIYATSNFNQPIEFQLQNPFDNTESIGNIKIINKAIAASSPSLRKWTTANTKKNVHHLIDYKSGEPVNDIASVFTVADSATNADVASTALFVSPRELFNSIAGELKIDYLIVNSDKTFEKSLNYFGELNK